VVSDTPPSPLVFSRLLYITRLLGKISSEAPPQSPPSLRGTDTFPKDRASTPLIRFVYQGLSFITPWETNSMCHYIVVAEIDFTSGIFTHGISSIATRRHNFHSFTTHNAATNTRLSASLVCTYVSRTSAACRDVSRTSASPKVATTNLTITPYLIEESQFTADHRRSFNLSHDKNISK
jgi:hypothetical protein